jgi:hypothetical protein
MRIFNRAHVPWFIFVLLATVAAVVLYVANFHPQRMPVGIHLPAYLTQKPSEHRSVGGTPLGLIFGAISFAIFIFATLFGVRKKVVLWRLGTLQRWMRAHIWLTLLTIPLVLLHSGFRLGGPMTTLLMALYAIVMVSGIYGLILQHQMPHLMKERLPAETVFEQIPHIRSQLYVAAEKLRDSFRPVPPKKTDAGAPAPSPAKSVTAGSTPMSSTAGDLSTPTARAKSTVGSTITAEPISPLAATAAEVAEVKASEVALPVAEVADPDAQKIPSPPAITSPQPLPASAATNVAKPAPPAAPVKKPAVATAAKLAPDPASEAALVEFIERQVLPYLSARRGEKFRLNNARFSDDTFRFAKLRVAEAYRSRVEEIQAWCDERRMLDLQTKLHHWLHAWLFVHVPFSFLLLMLTAWHAFVTLFYY